MASDRGVVIIILYVCEKYIMTCNSILNSALKCELTKYQNRVVLKK